MEPLLSIVVPTKNRTEYLKVLVETICSFQNDKIELVIHDNSDSNEEMRAFLEEGRYNNVVYSHSAQSLSVVDNSNKAIQLAHGKYVCFIGDDDVISSRLYDFVEYMDEFGIESAVFKTAQYYWPDTKFKAHKFPNLIIKNFKGKFKEINNQNELSALLKRGGVSLGNIPKLYHGVVLRERLEDIYRVCGTYFPGPSPDMANAIALSHFITKHVYCDIPLVIAGASPKSAAGLGTAHAHKGNLKDVAFLPKGVEDRWNERLPKIWTGPTIYAQSVYEALIALNDKEALNKFNYCYNYAYFSVFCSKDKYLLKDIKKKYAYSGIKFMKSWISIFCLRVRIFVSNKLLLWFGIGGETVNNVPNTLLAQNEVDKKISEKRMEKVLSQMKK